MTNTPYFDAYEKKKAQTSKSALRYKLVQESLLQIQEEMARFRSLPMHLRPNRMVVHPEIYNTLNIRYQPRRPIEHIEVNFRIDRTGAIVR